jgi:hypothetical protein
MVTGRPQRPIPALISLHGGLIMALLDHLRQENWAPAIPIIDRTLRAGVRIRHIPAPSGHTNWLDEDYEELLAEFLAAGRGPARLVQLAVSATDDQHLRGLLDKTVKWFLADRAREDPLPKLRRTLRTTLDRMPTVVVVDPATVSLVQCCHQEPWAGDESKLLAVAATVITGPPPWGADAVREGPPTDKESFEALCAAILDMAGAPLSLNTLTRVVGERLQLRRRWDDRIAGLRPSPTRRCSRHVLVGDQKEGLGQSPGGFPRR